MRKHGVKMKADEWRLWRCSGLECEAFVESLWWSVLNGLVLCSSPLLVSSCELLYKATSHWRSQLPAIIVFICSSGEQLPTSETPLNIHKALVCNAGVSESLQSWCGCSAGVCVPAGWRHFNASGCSNSDNQITNTYDIYRTHMHIHTLARIHTYTCIVK